MYKNGHGDFLRRNGDSVHSGDHSGSRLSLGDLPVALERHELLLLLAGRLEVLRPREAVRAARFSVIVAHRVRPTGVLGLVGRRNHVWRDQP